MRFCTRMRCYKAVIGINCTQYRRDNNEYLVLGSLEPSSWRKREKEHIEFGNVQEHVNDFKEYLNMKHIPAHWGPANEK
jgi:hypothetical protein